MSLFIKDNCFFVQICKNVDGSQPINRYDIGTRKTEQQHCFSIYRIRITEEDLGKKILDDHFVFNFYKSNEKQNLHFQNICKRIYVLCVIS